MKLKVVQVGVPTPALFTYSPAATRTTTVRICTPTSADKILRKAFERAGIEGASTHSFRRTALSQMSNAGIPLRIIQEISGHSNLEQLQRYERCEARSSQRSDRLAFHAFLHGEICIKQKLLHQRSLCLYIVERHPDIFARQ
jgi:hypothetical protein